MERKHLILLAVIGLAALAGCLQDDGTPPEQNTEASTNGVVVHESLETGEGVVRFVDEEAGVVCYGFAQNTGYDGQGGLSCLPLNETSL